MDATHIKQLRNNSLFSGLDEVQFGQILNSAQVKPLANAERLFNKGDEVNHFFWLRSGLLKLYRLSPNGEEKVIEIIRPGQTFAEAILFSGKLSHYPVNAEMIEAGEVWCFCCNDFRAVLENSVETCFQLLASFSQRLHKHVNEIDRLTLQTATDRVINYLLQNKPEDSNEVQLVTSKQTLASQLSVKPETLSRTLKKLTQEGLITANGNIIILQSPDALRARVEI